MEISKNYCVQAIKSFLFEMQAHVLGLHQPPPKFLKSSANTQNRRSPHSSKFSISRTKLPIRAHVVPCLVSTKASHSRPTSQLHFTQVTRQLKLTSHSTSQQTRENTVPMLHRGLNTGRSTHRPPRRRAARRRGPRRPRR